MGFGFVPEQFTLKPVSPDGLAINGYLFTELNKHNWHVQLCKASIYSHLPQQWEQEHCGECDDLIPHV